MSQSESALSVTELNQRVKHTLETPFRNVWVEGEVTDIARPHSGHIYMTLKDSQSQVRAVIWRSTAQGLPFDLKDGQSILCQGNVDVYGARGTYQLVIRRVEMQGQGNLQLALRQLQQRLGDEGLFDSERKKPISRFPRRIGLITSPTSAAVRDFLEVARRRWPGIDVLIIPAKVQGAKSAEDVVVGILAAHQITPSLDVVVIARGGGSLEDLWCFNDERVVRAICAAEIPIVSGIGHEIDITLTDLAADRRGLTPSNAAEIVVPSMSQWQGELTTVGQRLRGNIRGRITLAREQLRSCRPEQIGRAVASQIAENTRKLDDLEIQMRTSLMRSHERRGQEIRRLADLIEAVSPLAVLARGYSFASNSNGDLVRSAEQLAPGDTIETTFADGTATSRVIETRQNKT